MESKQTRDEANQSLSKERKKHSPVLQGYFTPPGFGRV